MEKSKIKDLFLKLADASFIRFCIIGVLATGIHYGIYYLLMNLIPTSVAYTIGYAISFCCNYLLSAKFTFRKKISAKNGIGFAMSHLVNWGLQLLCLNLFISLGLSKALAPIPTYCICVPVNFLLVRFVFKKF